MDHIARQRRGAAINVYAMLTRLSTPPTDGANPPPCGQLAADFGMRTAITSAAITAANNCSRWLTKVFGTNATNAFSLDSAARDLASTLQLVQTQEFPANPNVYLFATGKTSRIVQRFMAGSHASNTSIAGYIFDTPHMMKLPPTYDEITGTSTSRFLDGCDLDPVCSAKYANLSLSMRGVMQNILTQTVSTNPSRCVGLLANASFNGDRDLFQTHGLRRFIARVRTNPSAMKYSAPLLYRVQRCSDTDAYMLSRMIRTIAVPPPVYRDQESLAVFADRVVTYSEFWPTPLPSTAQLVQSFNKSLVSEGMILGQQAMYCLYTASDAKMCVDLYKPNQAAPNGSLQLTYTPSSTLSTSVNSSTGLVGSSTSDVLILTSRLNPVGSAGVARDLYDAFAGPSTTHNTILIESDNVLISSELDSSAGDKLLQVIALFVTKEAKSLTGKWRLEDLPASNITTTDWSKVASTYASPRAVSVDFTLSKYDRDNLVEPSGDLYEYVSPAYARFRPLYSSSSSDDGNTYLYMVLVFGWLLLVMFYMEWRRHRKRGEETEEETPPPSVQVNVVMHPPAPHPQPYQYGYGDPPPLPHAIPVHSFDPQQQLRGAPPATSAATAHTPWDPLPPRASPQQWIAEPVNEYAYGYTPAATRPPPNRSW
jgi:hypothetical protein